MTKLYRLFFIFSLLFIISCSKDPTPRPENPNLKLTGSSAEDLLSDAKYTSLYLELMYVQGYKPTEEAVAVLVNFLRDRVYKPDGIVVEYVEVSSSGKAPFNIEEIAEIEKEERTAYNQGDEIAVWIYFADGKNETDTNSKVTLGSAFRNTSLVIYEKTIKDFAFRQGAPDRAVMEASVLNHEFGHLFGLVNLGIDPVTEHEEFTTVNGERRGGHCNVEGCLMRASIEFGGGVLDIGNNIPPLDDACILDLQSVGGK